MGLAEHDQQLELFDLADQHRGRPYREGLGRLSLHVRYDQAVLAGIAGLMGVAVIFACGVERGKQLVRYEQVLLAAQQQALLRSPSANTTDPQAAQPQKAKPPAASASQAEMERQRAPSPSVTPKAKPATKLASAVEKRAGAAPAAVGKSRYAIQLATYSRAPLAKQQMDRLKAQGEPAFLMIREGRTAVYVGPFPSKTRASKKLTMLKSRYQDCFIRTL